MEVKLEYRNKKGYVKGVVGIWVNDDEMDNQEIIKHAVKQVESHSDIPVLTGDERWSILRDIF